MENNKLRKKKFTPSREDLKNAIIEKMRELNLWDDRLLIEIPTSWDSYNNFIVFSEKYFTSYEWKEAGISLWEHLSNLFSHKSIAIQGRINNDEFRSPNARVVYGESQWVNFLDNGIWYTWNLEFTMFCSGNVSERHRVATFNCEGETVVDMFSGIGYFTLPYLVHAKAKHVFACEWNPKSIEALLLNLAKNEVVDKCTVLQGDVIATSPRGVADRINMGLIPSCEQYWSIAAEILKPSGGILHVHGNVTSFSPPKNPLSQCEKCLIMLKNLSIELSDRTVMKNLSKFIVKNTGMLDIKWTNNEDSNLKWKKLEWFVWTVHVCHSFCCYLSTLTNTIWNVRPIFLHRVKAYAPHIDHLVLDISCENTMSYLIPQDPQIMS